ncbi:MAG: hypothetical protein AB7I79_06210 [Rhizobiaceae bacterium]
MDLEVDRLVRAGNYVAGILDDAERERAERDMETDPAFRDAVVAVAERMHLFDLPQPPGEERWRDVSARISALPQMRNAPSPAPERPVRRVIDRTKRPVGRSLNETGDNRATPIAIGLAAAFALGILVGKWWL